MAYTTVLVGIDGSPAALHAVDRAAYAAKREDAKLVLVCAYHPMAARDSAARTTGLADTKYRVTGTDAAQQALDAALLRARGAGACLVEGRLVQAHAVEALLGVAKELGADMIVVANRSATPLSSRLLGSVAAAVVHRAPCDVLVVHVRQVD